MGKPHPIPEFHKTDQDILDISRELKMLFIARKIL